MKNITFIESGMENFGPYIDPMLLTFQNDSLTLLVGPNGIGKTVALDSIPFTLFGMTSKGLKGDDLVNNVVGKNCHTWVKFNIDDDNYIVKRYQKYSKFGGNNVILNKNGVDIKSGAREVQPEIEKLICPQKGFMNSQMFGQKVKDFFTDLTDSKQKEIFRKLLGLDNYVEYYKEVSSKIDLLSNSVQEAKQKINIKEQFMEESTSRIKELIEEKNQFEIEKKRSLEIMEKRKRDAKKFLEKHLEDKNKLLKEDHEPAKIEVEWNKLINELSKFDMQIRSQEQDIISKKESKIHELKQTASNKKETINKEFNSTKDFIVKTWHEDEKKIDEKISNEKDEKNKLENDINSLQLESQYLQNSIDKINKSVFEEEISKCPICHQSITDHTKEDLENEIIEYKNQINDIVNRIEKNNITLQEFNKKRIELENEKRQLDKETGINLDQSEQEKENKINDIEKRLSEVLDMVESSAINEIDNMKQSMMESRNKLTNIIEEIKEKYNESKKVEEELNSIEETIQLCENTIKTIEIEYKKEEESEYDETSLNRHKGKIVSLSNDISKINEDIKGDERKLEINNFWKIAYSPSGIPSMLIDEAIPFMNKKVAEYLEELSNGRYIVSFDTQGTIKSGEMRDKISVNVLDTYTRANQRGQLSGGQTRLVDISTILTLGDLQSQNLGININLLIFDEIFDSLDAQNIDYVSKVLIRLKKGRSIYLVSHTHQDQLEADEILELKK